MFRIDRAGRRARLARGDSGLSQRIGEPPAPRCEEAKPWLASLRRSAWQFLEDRQSSTGACVYSYSSMLVIVGCVAISLLDLVVDANVMPLRANMLLEVPFMIELTLRLLVCPNRTVFWLDPYNAIDLFVIVGTAVPRMVATAVNAEPDMAYACRSWVRLGASAPGFLNCKCSDGGLVQGYSGDGPNSVEAGGKFAAGRRPLKACVGARVVCLSEFDTKSVDLDDAAKWTNLRRPRTILMLVRPLFINLRYFRCGLGQFLANLVNSFWHELGQCSQIAS